MGMAPSQQNSSEDTLEVDGWRRAGGQAIVALAHELAMVRHIALTGAEWNLGGDFAHNSSHRLDLHTATRSAVGYFLDQDLLHCHAGRNLVYIGLKLHRMFDVLTRQ
jgi:hypothetical protein